jgi:hypothetical protein
MKHRTEPEIPNLVFPNKHKISPLDKNSYIHHETAITIAQLTVPTLYFYQASIC